MRDLQAFLIKRFIYILVLVTVAQSLISFLISQAVMPVVMKVFFPDYQRQSSVGKTDLFIFIICVLLLLIVNAVRMLLPSPLQGMMQWTGERLQDWLGNALPATRSSVVVQEMEGWKAILLFVVLLLLMVCMLLPYILGAITFARIVMAEFHQIQEEREQQQREFDRKRNLMLSDIAHDLRTPVTTVSGYAKALADHMVQEPEKQQEYLNAIQNKSVRIGNLINLLFEYVKLDSEGFALNGKTLDLCELLRENAAMLYAEMEENGMTLTADIPEETIPVWADELQLSRVVTNLLTNAMQHNPKGTRIGLFAYRELERIYVLVADSGILIPEEQAQHLFDPFTRGDKARVSDGRNGLVYADYITTVSDTYAQEIQTEYYGEGLNGLLSARHFDMQGIVNGIDYTTYNPQTDSKIYMNYDASSFRKKKYVNKERLQEELGLDVDRKKYMIGLISRLTDQKGLDLINAVMDGLVDEFTQLVVIGTGEPQYENMFRHYAWKYPNRVSANICYSDDLAHKLYAAADAFLMPSRFEPCGLTQMISFRYGTVPIVRETGGLKDTVQAYNEYDNSGDGFSFANYNADEMLQVINYSKHIFYDRKRQWNQMVDRGMANDFSWNASKFRYEGLYNYLLGE